MKRLFSFILCVVLCCGLTGCNHNIVSKKPDTVSFYVMTEGRVCNDTTGEITRYTRDYDEKGFTKTEDIYKTNHSKEKLLYHRELTYDNNKVSTMHEVKYLEQSITKKDTKTTDTSFTYNNEDMIDNLQCKIDNSSIKKEYEYTDHLISSIKTTSLTNSTDSDVTETFDYDTYNNIINYTKEIGNKEIFSKQASYSYDQNKNLTDMSDFEGDFFQYKYNEKSQLTEFNQYGEKYIISYDNNKMDLIKGDTESATYEYDNKDRLSAMKQTDSFTINIEYDDHNNISDLYFEGLTDSGQASIHAQYTYKEITIPIALFNECCNINVQITNELFGLYHPVLDYDITFDIYKMSREINIGLLTDSIQDLTYTNTSNINSKKLTDKYELYSYITNTNIETSKKIYNTK